MKKQNQISEKNRQAANFLEELCKKAVRMLEGKHKFKFTLPEEKLRKMNKQQYKETMSWLRKCRWVLESSLGYKDKVCYGQRSTKRTISLRRMPLVDR